MATEPKTSWQSLHQHKRCTPSFSQWLRSLVSQQSRKDRFWAAVASVSWQRRACLCVSLYILNSQTAFMLCCALAPLCHPSVSLKSRHFLQTMFLTSTHTHIHHCHCFHPPGELGIYQRRNLPNPYTTLGFFSWSSACSMDKGDTCTSNSTKAKCLLFLCSVWAITGNPCRVHASWLLVNISRASSVSLLIGKET